MEIDIDKAEAKMFPFGKIGDVRFDTGQQEMVVIEECEPEAHDHHGEEHEHVYLPTKIGGVRRKTIHDIGDGSNGMLAAGVVTIRERYQIRKVNKPEQLRPIVNSDKVVENFRQRVQNIK